MSDEMTPGGSSGATLACPAGVAPEHLSAWRDGLQPPEQAQWLATHTTGCAACQARLRDYDQIGSALRSQMIPTSRADPWPAMRRLIAGEQPEARLRQSSAPAWSRLGAVVAAALLVALFAGLLARQASQRPTPGVTPTAGATATATAVPAGVWTYVAAYRGVDGLVVAPSDPRVAYQMWAAPARLTLRRTDDQGASWHDLTPPSISGVTYPNIAGPFLGFVSPIDPHVVYLIIGVQTTAGCGANGVANGQYCQLEYVSADSGQTWRPLALPAPGLMTALGIGINGHPSIPGNIEAQGRRLYSVITSMRLGTNTPPPPARLIVSDDGGFTWRLIDGAFRADGQGVYAYAATPSGTTIFVATESLNQPTGAITTAPQIMLWRSVDGGAHWTQIGHPPNTDLLDMRVAWDAPFSTSILYLETADYRGRMYLVGGRFDNNGGSIDGPIVSLGIDPPGGILLTTLSDGSALIETKGAVMQALQTSNSSAQANVVTQADGMSAYASAFTQTLADGATRLWLVGQDEQGVVVEYATLRSGTPSP